MTMNRKVYFPNFFNNPTELQFILAGKPDSYIVNRYGNTAIEKMYCATLPAINPHEYLFLWISEIVNDLGEHQIDWSISDYITINDFKKRHDELIKEKNDISLSSTYYSFDHSLGDQLMFKYRGPNTMIYVLKHLRNLIAQAPSGDTLYVYDGRNEVSFKKSKIIKKFIRKLIKEKIAVEERTFIANQEKNPISVTVYKKL